MLPPFSAAKRGKGVGAALAFSKGVPHLSRLALTLLMSSLAACGGKASGRPDDGGTAATGSGGSGAGGSGTSGTGSGGKGHAGSAGTGGTAECARFDDDAAASVNVAISNETKATIYLGQEMVTCGISPLFEVADADGATLPSLGDCRSPCVSLRQQGAGGCLGNCPFPNAVQLQPHEVLYTTWQGLFSVQGQLPARCVSYDTGGEAKVSCDQAKRIEPGMYTFTARAGSAFDCSQTSGSGLCAPCTVSRAGGCSIAGGVIAGPIHTTETSVLLDENYGIYPAASPNPGSNPNDEAPAPGALPDPKTVELVFTE